MALSDYSELKAAIAAHLERPELDDDIPTFIALAEGWLKDDIRIRELEKRSQATLDERFLALPNRYAQMRHLRLIVEGRALPLREVGLEAMTELRSECPGIPQYYTVHEELEFDRVPEEPITAEMVYYAHFLPLSEDNPTNEVLQRAPHCYFYGSLVAASEFLVDDERIPLWTARYESAKDSLTQAERRSRYGGPLISRVA